MRVKFKTNLGGIDATAIYLDYSKCCIGMEVDVSDAIGKSLVDRGVAETVDQPVKGVAKSAAVQGVPKKVTHAATES